MRWTVFFNFLKLFWKKVTYLSFQLFCGTDENLLHNFFFNCIHVDIINNTVKSLIYILFLLYVNTLFIFYLLFSLLTSHQAIQPVKARYCFCFFMKDQNLLCIYVIYRIELWEFFYLRFISDTQVHSKKQRK